MRTSALIAYAASLLSPSAFAAYTLEDDYSPSNFAGMFDFFTADDPTTGYVNYISQSQAESSGLYSANSNSVYMGVDSTNVATGRGRDSIRISSKKSYNHGLIILDLAHMPGGQCGTWPAFWLLGPDWPNQGELDIIEGVNSATTNSFAGHTRAGCSITSTGAFSGTLETANCDINAPGQGQNVGCAIHTGNTQTYGAGFNTAGGGVYATEWTSEAISIWFFPRSAIPSDISSNNPNPDNWGLPIAQFTGGCDIDEYFTNQQIIFDITFCGQWAGQVWGDDAVCSSQAATCQDYVQNNPTAFSDTYWSINYLRVFQENGAVASMSSGPAVSTVTATATFSSTSLQPTTLSTLTSAITSIVPPATPLSVPTTYTTYTNTWPSNSAWSTYTQSWSAPTATAAWTGWGQDGQGQGQGQDNDQGGGWGGRGGGGRGGGGPQ